MKHALTKFRENNGNMSLKTFADKIGASKSQVWKWENLKAEPRPIYRQRIIEATNGIVSASDMLLPSEAIPQPAE